MRCRKNYDGLETVTRVPDRQSADESFRYESLWQAVCKLPEKERSCILLFYKEDLSIKDIAAVMGIPAGSVKAYLSRGREKLKTELKDESL